MFTKDEVGKVLVGGKSVRRPSAFWTRTVMQNRDDVRGEFSSRRPSFRSGAQIEMPNGQIWILPSPPLKSEANESPFKSGYTSVIRAIIEAEDSSEQCLGELALAILLLDHNYYLSSEDYHRLLPSEPSEWQVAFHEIAREHVRVHLDLSSRQVENRPFADAR